MDFTNVPTFIPDLLAIGGMKGESVGGGVQISGKYLTQANFNKSTDSWYLQELSAKNILSSKAKII